MFGLGPLEILVILVFALLLFGRRLPEIGRGVGKSIIEFKKGLAGMEDELRVDGSTPTDTSKNQSKQANKTTNQLSSDSSASVDSSATQNTTEKQPPSQS